MAPFTVECQLEPRGDKWNPFGTPDSNSVLPLTGELMVLLHSPGGSSFVSGRELSHMGWLDKPL